MNQDCSTNTDSQMQVLMPMILMGENSSTSDLMMLTMMQSMGENPVDMSTLMPFLMLDNQSEDSNILMMVLMNSMTGGLNNQVIYFEYLLI